LPCTPKSTPFRAKRMSAVQLEHTFEWHRRRLTISPCAGLRISWREDSVPTRRPMPLDGTGTKRWRKVAEVGLEESDSGRVLFANHGHRTQCHQATRKMCCYVRTARYVTHVFSEVVFAVTFCIAKASLFRHSWRCRRPRRNTIMVPNWGRPGTHFRHPSGRRAQLRSVRL
jgi:hypothetical protein